MAPRPTLFEQSSGFRPVTPAQEQAAFDALNAPLHAAFSVHELGYPVDMLPSEASKARLRALRQRAVDLRAIYLPCSDELRELRVDRQKADIRLKQLKMRQGNAGPELDDNDPQVIDLRKKLTRLDGEIVRLSTLEQTRAAAMNAVGMLVRACEEWLRKGKPGGTVIIEAAAIDVADVLKKGERLVDALERTRNRLRELDADRHRINSAAFPSADVKRKLRSELENRAMRAVPDVSAMIEHDGELGWPMTPQTLPLIALDPTGKPVIGRAEGNAIDAVGLLCWILRPQLLQAVEALVDSEADDDHAMSVTDREVKLAELERDRLVIERHEAALVWHGQAQGDSVEHRADASPAAVLGIALQTRAA
jgi:hypothetical protein